MTDSTRTLRSTDDASAPLAARLLVIEGPDRGREARVEGTAIIGSRADATLVLTDDAVSRQHVALELSVGRVRVRDLESKNGTRYLGARVTMIEVPLGAVLELGVSRVVVLPPEVPAETVSAHESLAGLIGRSVVMRRLFAQIERVAGTDAAVLISGESGSGKEGVARAVHAVSARAKGPLEIFDCASVAPGLVHAALFGSVKGAFSGAVRDTPGALMRAHGGTLFLDEIGELPLDVQPTLLRALQTQTFTPVGDRQVRRVDFRVVAVTHRTLADEVTAGRFRADLYHRLAAIELRVPPLRDRLEDIPLLAAHFLHEAGVDAPLPRESVTALLGWRWPGNVRELRNAVLRMTALGADAAWSRAPDAATDASWAAAREKALKAFEYGYLRSLLERHRGSSIAAAREAGIARSYFFRLLAEHGLKGHGRGA